MAHIQLKNEQLPGIVGLFDFRPEMAKPLTELAEVLLRGPSTLSRGEREIIAASVSHWNQCHFCHSSHAAAAAAHLNTDLSLSAEIQNQFLNGNINPKLRALLEIAHLVQQSGKCVSHEVIEKAKSAGATDVEIHDTVLIAAAFCMFNRYVDGLGTWAPEPIEAYQQMGERMAFVGYLKYGLR